MFKRLLAIVAAAIKAVQEYNTVVVQFPTNFTA